MRKLLAIFLAGLMLFGLLACGSDGTTSAPESQTTTTATTVTTGGDVGGETNTTAGRKPTTTGETEKTTKPAFTIDTSNEKPVTSNISTNYNEMHSQSDAQANAMRNKVLNAKDEVKASATGKTYYVSYKGSDSNDGTSPAKAWRTTKRVGEAVKQFKAGDVVLFERGGVYRGSMQYVSGMKVGAYGTGAKPQLYAGPCNIADAKYWEETKYENVWKLDVSGLDDIGNIVFDHGKVCASTTRMFKEFLITESKYKPQDFYYYHNVSQGYVYMYYSKGNPGEDFASIELCPKTTVVTLYVPSGKRVAKDVVIDNLCIRYSGAFGITGGHDTTNITITNCEIGYIGGSLQNVSVRYGNGIELNGVVHGAEIRNNWIYQCYDAGYTHQCGGIEENIHVDANLIEYCHYNIEFFLQSEGHMNNMVIENNILRFAGYGFGSKNRYGSGIEYGAHISGSKSPTGHKGSIVRNNIFDTSLVQLVMISHADGKDGPKFEGNTWIQWNDKTSASVNLFNKNVNSDTVPTRLAVTDLASLKAGIAKIDSNPKAVIFYEKK
jgi:hypothetical protein